MTQLLIDSDVPKNFAKFEVPSNRGNRSFNFLKGQIVLSTQKDVMIGDGVVIVTGAMNYVLETIDSDKTIFEVEMVENDRKKNEDDPAWFAHTVTLPKQFDDNTASIKAHLDIVLAQAEAIKHLL